MLGAGVIFLNLVVFSFFFSFGVDKALSVVVVSVVILIGVVLFAVVTVLVVIFSCGIYLAGDFLLFMFTPLRVT